MNARERKLATVTTSGCLLALFLSVARRLGPGLALPSLPVYVHSQWCAPSGTMIYFRPRRAGALLAGHPQPPPRPPPDLTSFSERCRLRAEGNTVHRGRQLARSIQGGRLACSRPAVRISAVRITQAQANTEAGPLERTHILMSQSWHHEKQESR